MVDSEEIIQNIAVNINQVFSVIASPVFSIDFAPQIFIAMSFPVRAHFELASVCSIPLASVIQCNKSAEMGMKRYFQTARVFHIPSCMTIRVVSPGRGCCFQAVSVYSESWGRRMPKPSAVRKASA